MPATPNCQQVETLVLERWPHARFGRYNCRHISSNPLRSWSQHAGSEPELGYRGNALDIWHVDHKQPGKPPDSSPAHQSWLRLIYAYLSTLNDTFIDQLLGPGDRAHSNHVHVSTWPKMKSNFWYTPPCKDGELVVIYSDGKIGDTFGPPVPPPPPPTMEDFMALRRNDVADAVGKLQKGLIAWNPLALPEFGADKDYGAETEDWVGQYQDEADFANTQDWQANGVRGVADSVTIAYILSNLADEGAKGDQGDPGPQGPAGPQGAKGDPGAGLSTGDQIVSVVQ